ncbi:amidohydrolase family protein [Nannochloropsis oceanica]
MPQRFGRRSKRLRPFPNVASYPTQGIALCLFMLVLSHLSTTAKAFQLRTSLSSSKFSHRLRRVQYVKMASSSSSSFSTPAPSSRSSDEGTFPYRLIDSHHHVWTDGEEPFPYANGQSAPPGLQDSGTAEKFLTLAAAAGVERSLIVQPILYLYDHSYVRSVLQAHPGKFEGMLNANPTLSPEAAAAAIVRLHGEGFKSIRFNPYIWPAGEKMDNDVGRAMFAEAGRLGMPVGLMLFKGLHLHLPEVNALLSLPRSLHPPPPVILDHWGFFHQDGRDVPEAWDALLSLAQYSHVTVKISAFFRVSSQPWPFHDLAPRLEELVRVFGSERLMWGSDFPYVTTMGGGYAKAPRTVLEWRQAGLLPSLTERDYQNLFSGTYLKVFGGQ